MRERRGCSLAWAYLAGLTLLGSWFGGPNQGGEGGLTDVALAVGLQLLLEEVFPHGGHVLVLIGLLALAALRQAPAVGQQLLQSTVQSFVTSPAHLEVVGQPEHRLEDQDLHGLFLMKRA